VIKSAVDSSDRSLAHTPVYRALADKFGSEMDRRHAQRAPHVPPRAPGERGPRIGQTCVTACVKALAGHHVREPLYTSKSPRPPARPTAKEQERRREHDREELRRCVEKAHSKRRVRVCGREGWVGRTGRWGSWAEVNGVRVKVPDQTRSVYEVSLIF
jgi:hypothetical protein